MHPKLNGKIISICGPDGIGKTTQIMMLKYLLEAQGYKADIVWIRVLHIFSYVIYHLLKDKLEIALRNRHLRLIWLWFEVYNITLKIAIFCTKRFFRRYFKRGRCYVYLAERYLLDSIVSIIVFFIKDIKFMLRVPIKFLILRALNEAKHKKVIFVFLNLNAKDIIKRRMHRNSVSDKHLKSKYARLKALQHTKMQNILYKVLIRYVNGFVLDASQHKSEITKRIYMIIRKEYT